jgi:hypothetical protein
MQSLSATLLWKPDSARNLQTRTVLALLTADCGCEFYTTVTNVVSASARRVATYPLPPGSFPPWIPRSLSLRATLQVRENDPSLVNVRLFQVWNP